MVALAEARHFGRAAKMCFVSQPTLSIAVRKFEKELGVTLFERDKNDVRTTSLGKEVVKRAKQALAEVDGIHQVVQFDKDQLSGMLKLGVIYTVGPYLLPPLITELNKIAPQLSCDIIEDYTAHLREKLKAGEVDVIVVSLPFAEPGVVTRTLYNEPFVVLMPKDHPLAQFEKIHQKELSRYNMLMLGDGHCFKDQVVASCPMCFSGSSGVGWHTVAGSSLETIRHMVAAKMGITVLPATAAMSGPYQGNMLTTRPLLTSHSHRTIVLAWRKTFPRIMAVEMILQAVKQSALIGINR